MPDSPRIEELKRRVQSDPASIAFAALAEEYRRTGRYEEAIEVCRIGLQRHPSYISAHVTLGRALIEVAAFDEARQELEYVLGVAPENLAAIRGLAEIHHRRGDHEHTAPADFSESAVAAMGQAVAPFEEVASRPAAGVVPMHAPPHPVLETFKPPVPEPAPPEEEPAAEPAPVVGIVEPEQQRVELDAPQGDATGVTAVDDAIDLSTDMPVAAEPAAPLPPASDPAAKRLEAFLQAILRARQAAGGRRAS